MAIKDIFKVSRKTFFNPKGWLGYDFVKENTSTLVNTAKVVFKMPSNITAEARATPKESFEEAVQRFNLSEAEVKDVAQGYLFLAMLFVFFGLSFFGVGIYLLLKASIAGFILSISFGACFFAYAFKYHFWYFQIKHRKLGCTFYEWRQGKTHSGGDNEVENDIKHIQ